MSVITLKKADSLIAESIRLAELNNCCVSVVVVDRTGQMVALGRMDGCLIGPIDVAIKKARTAALFGMNSSDFGVISNPGGVAYSLEYSNGGLVSFGGGVVLKDGDVVIGGIGVAGASIELDDYIASYSVECVM